MLHEIVADFVGQHGVVEMDLRQPGDGAEQHVLDAGLGGGGDGDGVAVASQAGGDPQDVDVGDGGRLLGHPAVGLSSVMIAPLLLRSSAGNPA